MPQERQSGDIRERPHMIGNAVQMLVPVAGGAIKVGTSLSKFGVFGRGVEKRLRFEELANNITKSEARNLLRDESTDLSQGQIKNILKQLRSGRIDSVNIKKSLAATVHFSFERSSHTSGFQRMSFKINEEGQTLRVVQTAFDDMANLVHQAPGMAKNNLFDVKF